LGRGVKRKSGDSAMFAKKIRSRPMLCPEKLGDFLRKKLKIINTSRGKIISAASPER